jgi:hypothetical protein
MSLLCLILVGGHEAAAILACAIHDGLTKRLFLQIMKSDEDVRMISAEAPVLFAKVACLSIAEQLESQGTCGFCSLLISAM